jgi:hypothetical protein
VNEVNGSTVADWNANAGTLRVLLIEPVATEISFIVQAEARAARDGPVIVPLIRMPSAERETGGVAVDVVGAGEIAERQPRGMEPADPSELGEMAARSESPSMIAFRFRPQAGTEPRSLSVNIVRYMPQPVLVANVEEARYRTLASEDGLLLVHARYAVRNNQRGFLKVTLPEGATVWSAQIAGRPIRPGLAEGDAVLLPLDKGRPGEEAPTFAVEILYVQRIEVWNDKGRAQVDLPALDLPVLRTGVELYYPPRFRVEPVGRSFRLEQDPGPFAEALREPPATHIVLKGQTDERGASGLQELVDRFRDQAGGRIVVGSLPVDLTFPSFGPSMFFASELTAEARALSVELAYRRRY